MYSQNFDRTVRPQDDFYRYVNGQWLTTTEIPADRSNYGAFSMLEDGAERDLRAILEEASAASSPAGSDMQKVGDFYASFMDAATVEARGLTPLAGEFDRIDALATKQDVARYIGYSQRLFVAQPFAYFVAIDKKKSTEYVGTVYQTGLGMPDRDYYLSDDARLKSVREKYRVYVKDLLTAADTPNAASVAEKIFALESALATAHWTRVQNRDAEKTYNRYDLAMLRKLTPSFDWNAFLAGAQIPAARTQALIVAQPELFRSARQP